MYNHLCKFGFKSRYCTNDAIVQLVDEIFYSFKKQQFTLGVFIDLSKRFDTLNHLNLLKKLKYGIPDKSLAWFESYLSNRNQYNEIDENSKTDLTYVTCSVSQGSIVGPRLFLVYVNDLTNGSRLLDTIKFADDTNLFR